MTVTIDLEDRHQEIDNFGASDCWSARFVGLWPDAKRNAIADLLFSMDDDAAGRPRGIGLSLWRFNIGAGSAEQGEASGIATEWRRAECFQAPDGSWDWSRQAGQAWFLEAAHRRGVRQFLGFANSPPVQLTQNGLAYNRGRDDTLNLRPDAYGAYADFLADVVDGLERTTGVRLAYLSPFNEPEWDWRGNSQEGTPALNAEITRAARELDARLAARGLDTRIVVTESGKLDYVVRGGTDRPGRDDQLDDLFGPSSPNSIRLLPRAAPLIALHDYWSLHPPSLAVSRREELRAAAQRAGVKSWQTEVCLLETIPGVGGGEGRDLGMSTALFFAWLLHTDLVVAEVSAWQWWLGITYSDYKDGLVYVMPDETKRDGTFTASKLLWTLGNWSRFVRPGAVRVGAATDAAAPDDSLLVSAFAGPEKGTVVAVVVNRGDHACPLSFSVPGATVRRVTPYVTSDAPGDDLAPGPSPAPAAAKARSVTTFVVDIS